MREPTETPFERRFRRWMAAGAFTARHWRGVLLGLYLATLGSFGLLAWFGYRHNDRGWGSIFEVFFGVVALMMLMRFPRRLISSMRQAGRTRRATPPPQQRVIDTQAKDWTPPQL